jgi:hypothetical protein
MRIQLIGAATLAAGLAACGGDGNNMCDVAAQTGCSSGQVCEDVTGATPACFAPVEVRGHVSDLASTAPIAAAEVVALDINGGAVSTVVKSAADGAYRLPVPVERAADGTPVALKITLRADAAGYQGFPSGGRQALPLDTATATKGDGAWIVAASTTEVALVPLPASAGHGQIHGTVDVPADHVGALVVAERAGVGASAIVDRSGAYTIFNLGDGAYTVRAYARGHVYTDASATIASGGTATADLHLSADADGTLTGSVSIVGPGAGSATEIVAVVESTFDPVTGRGVAVPGVRAPDGGIAPNVSGAFSISGVPPGKYVVLAAFENDALVRDPDPCIAGTDFVHVDVAAGATVAAGQFKVTSPVALVGPGADAPEAVTTPPTLSWTSYPSTSTYDVHVFDALGNEVWTTNVPGTSVLYAGPFLVGTYYQFRVVAHKQGNTTCLISQSEDLRGLFYKP